MNTANVPTLELVVNEEIFKTISNALHDSTVKAINIAGSDYPISLHSNGCRHVKIGATDYIQQNPDKESAYAILAREGHKITWGMRSMGQWALIVDDRIHYM